MLVNRNLHRDIIFCERSSEPSVFSIKLLGIFLLENYKLGKIIVQRRGKLSHESTLLLPRAPEAPEPVNKFGIECAESNERKRFKSGMKRFYRSLTFLLRSLSTTRCSPVTEEYCLKSPTVFKNI